MTNNLNAYAKAFSEIQNDEKDLGTWAKAFSETSSENEAKKLYIKLRVEQLEITISPTSLAEGQPSAEFTDSQELSLDTNEKDRPETASADTEALSKPKVSFKTAPWYDKLAWMVLIATPLHFFSSIVSSNSFGIPIDFLAIVTGQLVLLYITFPIAVWRLIQVGSFTRLLPDDFGDPNFKARDNVFRLKVVVGAFLFLSVLGVVWGVVERNQPRQTTPKQVDINQLPSTPKEAYTRPLPAGCKFRVGLNDLQVINGLDNRKIIKHLPSGRLLALVDIGRHDAKVKARLQFAENNKDMCL